MASRRRSNSVAFGAKRTLSSSRCAPNLLRLTDPDMTGVIRAALSTRVGVQHEPIRILTEFGHNMGRLDLAATIKLAARREVILGFRVSLAS